MSRDETRNRDAGHARRSRRGGRGGERGGDSGCLLAGSVSGDEELSTFAMPSNVTSSEGSETADEAAPLNQAARIAQPVARTRGPRNV